MPGNLNMSLLLEFYGPMLSRKQLEMMDMYYNQDFSLSEIAQNEGITRQGVRAAVKKAEGIMEAAEERMRLAHRFAAIMERAGTAGRELERLIALNETELRRGDVRASLEVIRASLHDIEENA